MIEGSVVLTPDVEIVGGARLSAIVSVLDRTVQHQPIQNDAGVVVGMRRVWTLSGTLRPAASGYTAARLGELDTFAVNCRGETLKLWENASRLIDTITPADAIGNGPAVDVSADAQRGGASPVPVTITITAESARPNGSGEDGESDAWTETVTTRADGLRSASRRATLRGEGSALETKYADALAEFVSAWSGFILTTEVSRREDGKEIGYTLTAEETRNPYPSSSMVDGDVSITRTTDGSGRKISEQVWDVLLDPGADVIAVVDSIRPSGVIVFEQWTATEYKERRLRATFRVAASTDVSGSLCEFERSITVREATSTYELRQFAAGVPAVLVERPAGVSTIIDRGSLTMLSAHHRPPSIPTGYLLEVPEINYEPGRAGQYRTTWSRTIAVETVPSLVSILTTRTTGGALS